MRTGATIAAFVATSALLLVAMERDLAGPSVGHWLIALTAVFGATMISISRRGVLGIGSARFVDSLWLAAITATTIWVIATSASFADISEGPTPVNGPVGTVAVLIGVFAINELWLASEPLSDGPEVGERRTEERRA